MTFSWPYVVMGVWVMLILATAAQTGRFVVRFRERYPSVSLEEIPSYMFSKAGLEALGADPVLCRERRRFVALAVAIVGFDDLITMPLSTDIV